MRFRQFKKAARELQDEIEEISHVAALKHLVEQMWNAPLVPLRKKQINRMMTAKAFNTATGNFPLPVPPKSNIKNEKEKEMLVLEFQPLSSELKEPKELPVGASLGAAAGAASTAANANIAENAIGFAGEGNVIYFHHKQLNGIMRDHFVVEKE